METGLKISVIICSYNRATYIIDAIDSLYNQTASKDLYEVIVVDNNSMDNTKNCVFNISLLIPVITFVILKKSSKALRLHAIPESHIPKHH
jgi:GT2 family glycosyltransferase